MFPFCTSQKLWNGKKINLIKRYKKKFDGIINFICENHSGSFVRELQHSEEEKLQVKFTQK